MEINSEINYSRGMTQCVHEHAGMECVWFVKVLTSIPSPPKASDLIEFSPSCVSVYAVLFTMRQNKREKGVEVRKTWSEREN